MHGTGTMKKLKIFLVSTICLCVCLISVIWGFSSYNLGQKCSLDLLVSLIGIIALLVLYQIKRSLPGNNGINNDSEYDS